jgi:probable lipoprotein NlpC
MMTRTLFPKPRGFFLVLTLLASASALFAAPLENVALASRDARSRLISAAAAYERTPYRYGGLDRNGLDCSGLIYVSFKDALGVSVPRSTTGLYSWVEKIPDEKTQPGDILFFKTDNTGKISHAGIYAGNGRFIHAASQGPVTGVMYSAVSENYWSRAYAGAGRALPETDSGFEPVLSAGSGGVTNGGEAVAAGGSGTAANSGESAANSGWGTARPADTPAQGNSGGGKTAAGTPHLLLGAGIAPTWKAFLKGGDLVRGFASQLRVGAETYTFGMRMVFGLEIRPEYDGGLGVFRLPVTLSWGPSDKFLLFFGPAFSFGDAVISTKDGNRRYSGGTNWIGTVGFTAAPFLFSAGPGELAPYLEAAWQSYFSDNSDRNLNADFSAGFRFSTGIRYTFKL